MRLVPVSALLVPCSVASTAALVARWMSERIVRTCPVAALDCQTGAVAKVDEYEATVVAIPMDPALKYRLLTDVSGAQVAASWSKTMQGRPACYLCIWAEEGTARTSLRPVSRR